MDPVISKMLLLHLPARHPMAYPDLEMPAIVQAAALMGLGIVYQGSCHR
jgi:anaphase-promoting complex subunit 1